MIMFDFDARMVEYMKAARTLTQEEVDARAAERAHFTPDPTQRYEAQAHHEEYNHSEH